jgi:hypothetical protein
VKSSMDRKTRKALDAVIDYLWRDEHRHWQECGCPLDQDHIFIEVLRLAKWLGYECCHDGVTVIPEGGRCDMCRCDQSELDEAVEAQRQQPSELQEPDEVAG